MLTRKPVQSSTGRILINLGCGQTRPAEWINIDSSLNSLVQQSPLIHEVLKKRSNATLYTSSNARYMDLNRPWKFFSGSADVIYASHVFEHLSLSSADLFMREAFRVLKPGGILRIVVPDLYELSKRYVQAYENSQETASDSLLYALNLHKQGTYPVTRSLIEKLINLIQGYPHQHKYMYDSLSLTKAIRNSGFIDIKNSSYGKSIYVPEIEQVESTGEGIPSIYLEGRKPIKF